MPETLSPTNYGDFVIQMLGKPTPGSQTADQELVRRCLGLASSFLITDTAMNPESGLTSWSVGFNRLVDLVVALHARNELELVTINMASRACSECWTAGGSWRGLGQCRAEIRQVGGKLKRLLDPNGRTYKGESVYAP